MSGDRPGSGVEVVVASFGPATRQVQSRRARPRAGFDRALRPTKRRTARAPATPLVRIGGPEAGVATSKFLRRGTSIPLNQTEVNCHKLKADGMNRTSRVSRPTEVDARHSTYRGHPPRRRKRSILLSRGWIDGRMPNSPPARLPVRGRARRRFLNARGSRPGAGPAAGRTVRPDPGGDRRGRGPAGGDARAGDRPRAQVLPRPRRGTDGAPGRNGALRHDLGVDLRGSE